MKCKYLYQMHIWNLTYIVTKYLLPQVSVLLVWLKFILLKLEPYSSELVSFLKYWISAVK